VLLVGRVYAGWQDHFRRRGLLVLRLHGVLRYVDRLFHADADRHIERVDAEVVEQSSVGSPSRAALDRTWSVA
jgi:hypothetical protein